ncbi:glycoside hydrolase family 43 [Mucilaginibacter paludis DSM 18603]|uniref:Glycoside hydrolase family 43 n=1 Tax=Mucilaginibacter paludis DSM 18603 TaxID=714943 RepID=H1Y274_9SPHI|nr:glycoside hydrolase family 43 [Mucilaginibacter paludis DSM 18603]
MIKRCLVAACTVFTFAATAQQKLAKPIPSATNYVSKVWVADQGNGTYKNPVLNADYSDPDAIRVGDDFYLVSSSFEDMPGLPILHSKDLVNWTLIGHALLRQPPFDHFAKPRHGDGVWAPAIRYHNGEFYIYYPDPDYGIYVIKAKNAAGPWTNPALVYGGSGLIDPCPLWDEDGAVYLVHGWAGSRAGIKSIISINKLNADGTKVTDEGVMVFDGHDTDPTVEGPKLYKRNGYYYIFAPAGGVSTGWQLVLRSENIYGPYERRVVMDQSKSAVNGPHQGAWVDTETGEDWFLHFQDKGPYGRVMHLQPMKWINNWPVIGTDPNHTGKGEPVLTYKKPNVGRVYPIQTPPESDEFNGISLGLQWQWMANPKSTWYTTTNLGYLRLFSYLSPDTAKNLWQAPNVLLQKMPADEFMATTKFTFKPNAKLENERAGLVVMGFSYAGLTLQSKKDGIYLTYIDCKDAEKGKPEKAETLMKLVTPTVYFRVKVTAGAKCRFSYSLDGQQYTDAGQEFQAEVGRWIGAKVGLFCTRTTQTNDSGYADFDWFRVELVK